MPGVQDDFLGDVVHVRKTGGRPAKGHVGRQRKVHCEGCGVILYGSMAALTRSGLPVCGCGERMQLANLRDRAAVEWDVLELEMGSWSREAYNAAMRELGYTGRLETRTYSRQSGAVQRRCGWEGGQCVRFVSGRYCPEHEHSARPAVAVAARTRG